MPATADRYMSHMQAVNEVLNTGFIFTGGNTDRQDTSKQDTQAGRHRWASPFSPFANGSIPYVSSYTNEQTINFH